MLLCKVFNRRLSLVLGESCTIVVFFKRMADSSESERENYNIFQVLTRKIFLERLGGGFNHTKTNHWHRQTVRAMGLLRMGMTIPKMRMGYGCHNLETEKLDRFLLIIGNFTKSSCSPFSFSPFFSTNAPSEF